MPSETKVRTQEARRIINKEMRKFYRADVTDLPDLSIMYCFKKPLVHRALKQLERKYEKIEYPDISPMYEDAVTIKDISGRMFYISDRWCCVGRIKFILRVLDDLEVQDAIPVVEEVLKSKGLV